MPRAAWILIGVVVAIIAIVTLILAVRLLLRLVAMKRRLDAAGGGGKLAFWGALAYLVFPIDLLPDPIYLDDMAVVGGALLFLTRLLRKQETLRDGLPHAQALARHLTARRKS